MKKDWQVHDTSRMLPIAPISAPEQYKQGWTDICLGYAMGDAWKVGNGPGKHYRILSPRAECRVKPGMAWSGSRSRGLSKRLVPGLSSDAHLMCMPNEPL